MYYPSQYDQSSSDQYSQSSNDQYFRPNGDQYYNPSCSSYVPGPPPMSFNGMTSYQPAPCFTNGSQSQYYESYPPQSSAYATSYPMDSGPFTSNHPPSMPSFNFSQYSNYSNYPPPSRGTFNEANNFNVAVESASDRQLCTYETGGIRKKSYDRGTSFVKPESRAFTNDKSSAERFIAECQSGIKNRKRLVIEKKIEKDLTTSKPPNGPNSNLGGDTPHPRNGRYSSSSSNGYQFAKLKKPAFKRIGTKFGNKDNKEFLSSWR